MFNTFVTEIVHFRVAPSKPLFENEAKCQAIDMTIIFYSHANKTHFQKKDFDYGTVLGTLYVSFIYYISQLLSVS